MTQATVMMKGRDRAAIGAAIESGMVEARARQLNAAEMEMLRAEIRRLREENDRLSVRRSRDADYYHGMITEARYQYGNVRTPGKVGRVVWGLIGMIVEGVHGWWVYLDAINRGIDPGEGRRGA